MYGSVEPIHPFFMSVHISQEVEKWGAKVEVKRMDAKKRNLLLEWGEKYTADELYTADASYKIRVNTLENKGSVKWAVAANKWWNKVELFATAMSLVKDLSKRPERDHGKKRASKMVPKHFL